MNELLESLWQRVTSNIGDRIAQIQDLLTQALGAQADADQAKTDAETAVTAAQSHASDAATSASQAASSRSAAAESESNAGQSEQAAKASENAAAQSANATAGVAQDVQTAASNAQQSETNAKDYESNAKEYRDDAIAAGELAEEQAGIAVDAANRADPDGFRDAVNQRVAAVEGLVDSKADDSDLQALASRVDARPAFHSGVGAPTDVPNAVVGDYYFDTESGELHKITGV